MTSPAVPVAFTGTEAEARELLCRVGRELYASALIGGRAGNLSVRLDAERLLVTPRGAHKGLLEPADPVVVALEAPGLEAGAPPRDAQAGALDAKARAPDPDAEGRATSELPTHRAVYAARPDVAAVVHTHAPALIACGLRGIDPTAPFPEVEEVLGAVVRVPFLPSGSRELAAAVGEAARGATAGGEAGRGAGGAGDAGADVLLLQRHGALALGTSLEEARDRMELAELTARAALLAAEAGLEMDLGQLAALHERAAGRGRGG